MTTTTLISNKINNLPPHLRKYAFGQNESGELGDITLGKVYPIYGLRKTGRDFFYLTLQDDAVPDMLWWMPSCLYDFDPNQLQSDIPKHWTTIEYGQGVDEDTISAPEIYHKNIESIEDYTQEGKRAAQIIIGQENKENKDVPRKSR